MAIVVVATMLSISCGSKSRAPKIKVADIGLFSESDSLAYIVGMSVADQLMKMDSTINYDVVCRAIMEYSTGSAVLSKEEARQEYLRYLLYVEPERRRGYEEKFLADLAEGSREYTRTKSGLTYNIEVIGNEDLTPRNSGDWVGVKYRIERVGGEQIYPKNGQEAEVVEDALTDLPAGIEEALKMIGEGGRVRAWLPSKLAFGEAGDEPLGVKPIETLYYEIDLVMVKRGEATKRKKERQSTF